MTFEAGTFAGASAITWAKALSDFEGCRGSVMCVDAWRPYFPDVTAVATPGNEAVYSQLNWTQEQDRLWSLFEYNVSASGLSHVITHRREDFATAFSTLRDSNRKFDLVYIDGAHDYSSVVKDLHATMPLVHIGGIIAGDDLEVSMEEIDIDFAELHKERDFVMDPKTKRKFHPGVVLGVSAVLGKPRIFTGFWAFRRIGIDSWEPVEISTVSLPPIPPHLLEFP